MVFAARVAEGVKGPEDCPQLTEDRRTRLAVYLSPFNILA